MVKKETVKIALISGAAHALKYKKQNPQASDEEIIQYVSRESERILENLDGDY